MSLQDSSLAPPKATGPSTLPRLCVPSRLRLVCRRQLVTGIHLAWPPPAILPTSKAPCNGIQHGRIAMYANVSHIVPKYHKFPGELAPSLGLKLLDVPNGLAAFSKLSCWAVPRSCRHVLHHARVKRTSGELAPSLRLKFFDIPTVLAASSPESAKFLWLPGVLYSAQRGGVTMYATVFHLVPGSASPSASPCRLSASSPPVCRTAWQLSSNAPPAGLAPDPRLRGHRRDDGLLVR